MKAVFVNGICPPGTCGVTDYTDQLVRELCSLGINAEIMPYARWRVLDTSKAIKELQSMRPDIVHIQYPTVGFGYHLGPQLFALRRNCVVTLHEVSRSHVLRQLSLYPFVVRAVHIVFTSEYEREYASKWAPWINKVSTVIPVGSNVAPFSCQVNRRDQEISYFGLLMPKKGLEDVLKLAGLIKAAGLNFKIRVIGNTHMMNQSYLKELRAQSVDLPVVWQEKLEGVQLSKELAACSLAYLPFPDGASERRTTLKAMLAHGVPTITSRGAHTPKGLEEVVYFANSPNEAYEALRLLAGDSLLQQKFRNNALEYMRQFSWRRIALDHIRLYEAISRAKWMEAPSSEVLNN